MFNIGMTELIVIAVIGLIVIGPEQLPHLARKLAQLLNEFKRVKEDIMSPVDEIKDEAKQILEKSRHEMVAEIMNKKLYQKPNAEAESPPEASEKANKDENG